MKTDKFLLWIAAGIFAGSVLGFMLSGCSMMIAKHEKVEGWPELKIVEHYVPEAEMRDKCNPYVPGTQAPLFAPSSTSAGKNATSGSVPTFLLSHSSLNTKGFTAGFTTTWGLTTWQIW